MKNIKHLLLITCIAFTQMNEPASADDETKRLIGGIAAGVLGMALNEMSQNNQAQAEDIQWQSQADDGSSLEFNNPTVDVQKNLQKLGYYNGAIDGLQGGGTTSAIKSWESDNDLDVDGELSMVEYEKLAVQAHLSERPTALKSDTISEKDFERYSGELSTLFEHIYTFDTCKSFKQEYLTTDITQKSLKKADDFIQQSQTQLDTKLQCKGYGQSEIDRLYSASKALSEESEDVEKLDIWMQMLERDQDSFQAKEGIVDQCIELSDFWAEKYLQYYAEYRFDEKDCEYYMR